MHKFSLALDGSYMKQLEDTDRQEASRAAREAAGEITDRCAAIHWQCSVCEEDGPALDEVILQFFNVCSVLETKTGRNTSMSRELLFSGLGRGPVRGL